MARSKNDAYYSYRWRKIQKNQKYLSLEDWKRDRAARPKTADGKPKSDWQQGIRPPGWKYKTKKQREIARRKLTRLKKEVKRLEKALKPQS